MFGNMLMGAAGASLAGGGGYSVDNSILGDGTSDYLRRTISTTGSTQAATFSFWYKVCGLGTNRYLYSAGDDAGGDTADFFDIFFNTSDQLGIDLRIGTVDEVTLRSTRVFRDPHAWYHFVVNIDITNPTAADRVRVYVNGVRETDWSPNTNNLNGTENFVLFTAGEEQYVGGWFYDLTNPFDGYVSEFVCIDGSALDATSFGEYDENGVWRPIDVTEVATDRDQIPALTSNSAPSPYAVTASSEDGAGSEGYRMFANGSSSWRTASGAGGVANIVIDVGSANAFAATSLVLTGTSDAATRCPTNFTFEGSNTGSFSGEETVLYTGSSVSWSASETKTFTFSNTTSFRYYKLDVTSTSGGTYVEIEEGEIRKEVTGDFGTNGFYLPFSNGGDNQLIDSTDTARTYTWYGTNALITNAEAKFGTASYYSGNAALQNVDAVGIADSDDWRLGGGTGDFTVECWVNFSSVATNQGIVYQWDDSPITGGGGTASNGWHFWINDIASAPKVRFSYYESGSLIVDTQQSTSAFSTGTWYHLAVTREGNDYKLWRDGTQVGSTVTDSSTLPNVSAPLIIGGAGIGATDDLRGYLDEFRISTNARYTGSFTPSTSAFVDDANTSCLLHFDNIEGLGTDAAGSNFLWDYGSPTQSSDTPTNNFANLSSITETLGGAVTLSNGNLNAAGTAAVVWNRNPASIKLYAAAGGKYIFAVKPDAIGGGRGDPWVTNEDYGGGTNPTTQSNAWQCTMDTSSNFIEYDQGTGSTHTMSPAAATGDYMLVAIDLDNLKIWFGRYDASAGVTEWADNGTGWTGDPTDGGTTACATLTGNEFTVGVSLYTGRSCEVDFGQRSDILANITIPTGYGYISSSQIYTNAAPAIEDGTAHFQATAYTGNGSSIEVNQSGNSTFQPDFVWIKNRTNAYRHELFDAVRGVQKYLQSQETDAEGTDSTTLTSFDSDGYSYGSGIWGNTSGNNIVAWQWKGDGTSGSSNTDGSPITSTVNVNNTAGFSIVTWTGDANDTSTVGHGLDSTPELIIVKNRTDAVGWAVFTKTKGADGGLELDTSGAAFSSTAYFSELPNATVFTPGSHNQTNGSGDSMVSYCFHSVPGYSAFGSYTGNGSSDGPLITLDFSPAYFMLKRIDSTSNWHIYTIATEPYNVRDGGFYANTADAEQSWGTRILDIISNGIKFRGSDTNINASGGTYIYAAFAENPFAGTTPATAR